MGRHKDENFDPPHEWRYVHLYLLMDLRDELKTLNSRLSAVGCIHSTMKGLRRDIAKARSNHRRKI